jgi:hypothetical protein
VVELHPERARRRLENNPDAMSLTSFWRVCDPTDALPFGPPGTDGRFVFST